MDRKWIKDRRFSSLSIRDLLEAREAYHVHLAHLDNVFATAIGRYLIRNSDPDASDAEAASKGRGDPPRTLANSEAQKWSWPCILVFVDKWRDRSAFTQDPDSMVPRYLYLPDGRVVPTCVVYADRSTTPLPTPAPTFSSDLLGGGYPALHDVQGRTRVSTLGCLVTDGDLVYALTNRHVAGGAGRKIYTVVAGERQRIGESAGLELGAQPFDEVYPGWPGARAALNLDVGLIELDSLHRWTAQVFGVGEIGPIWDLHVDSFTLDLIDCPVRAHGAAGGLLEGGIKALFFRYKSVGGIEYVSDFLIGPRKGSPSLGTLPGDSGAVWFEDVSPDGRTRRPFAVQWGGQSLLSPGSDVAAGFALATCLSTACRELGVDVVADWNVGHPETWGAVGHFKIGAMACELAEPAWLRQLFMLNRTNIGFEDGDLGSIPTFGHGAFVPLADVADYVWRNIRKIDDNNHFADIDKEAPQGSGAFSGKSLLALTKSRPERVSPDYWNDFYEALEEEKRGALPFRVWQIYDEMVDFARDGDITKFVCAAGLMAHYVGDACQPLHVSELHHGSGAQESGVHSAYETAMLNRYHAELVAEIGNVANNWPTVGAITGDGHAAAVAVVELMRRTVTRLPPQKVIDSFNEHAGRKRSAGMWADLGKNTAKGIYDGAVTLARLWQGAWEVGRAGAGDPPMPAAAESHQALAQLYRNANFLKSYKLQDVTVKDGRIRPK